MEQPQTPGINKRRPKMQLWVAVFFVVGMLMGVGIGIGAASFLYGYSATPPLTPEGSFGTPTKISKDMYSIPFGFVARETKFSDCMIRILPASGTGPAEITTFYLTNGTFTRAATATAPGIAITDLNADNKINIGDLVTVTTRSSDYAAVDNGNWTIALIFISTLGQICSKIFTVSGNP
jgi:hypothetical protein